MELEIHEREREGIRILDLRGRLAIGESEAVLRRRVAALANAGAVDVILNCAHLSDIDEDGLTALVLCAAKLRKAGGALKLLNLNVNQMNMLVLIGLERAFDLFMNEQDAVNSFFPDRTVPHFDILEFVKQHQDELSSERPKPGGGKSAGTREKMPPR